MAVQRGTRGLPRVLAAAGLACAALAAAPAAAQVTRERVDQAYVRYAGLDLNGDDFPDMVLIGSLKQREDHVFLLGSPGGRQSRRRLSSFSEEERDGLQDLILEEDLDGDKIVDLIVLNSLRLLRRGVDDPGMLRLIESSIFIGAPGDTFTEFRRFHAAPEHREIILRKAQEVLRASALLMR